MQDTVTNLNKVKQDQELLERSISPNNVVSNVSHFQTKSANHSPKYQQDDKMEDDDQISQNDKTQIISRKGSLNPTSKVNKDGPNNPSDRVHLRSQKSNSLQSLLDKNQGDSHINKHQNSKDGSINETIEIQPDVSKSGKSLLQDKAQREVQLPVLEGYSNTEDNRLYQQQIDLPLHNQNGDQEQNITAKKQTIPFTML
eukprot:403337250